MKKQTQKLDYSYFYSTDSLFKPVIALGHKKEEANADDGKNKNIDLFKIPVRYLRWIMTQCVNADTPEGQLIVDQNKGFRILEFEGKTFEVVDRSIEPFPLFDQD